MMVCASISGPCIGTRHLVLFLTGLGKAWWNHSSKFSTFGQGLSPAARKALDNNQSSKSSPTTFPVHSHRSKTRRQAAPIDPQQRDGPSP